MQEWENRSEEISSLLNPAFLFYLIYHSVDAYTDEAKCGAPYLLPFITLPLVLHRQTRDNIPFRKTYSFYEWITDDSKCPEASLGFSDRASELVPYVKEALIFGMQYRYIEIREDGLLYTYTNQRLDIPASEASQNLNKYRDRIRVCGRWLAEPQALLFAMKFLQVQP